MIPKLANYKLHL